MYLLLLLAVMSGFLVLRIPVHPVYSTVLVPYRYRKYKLASKAVVSHQTLPENDRQKRNSLAITTLQKGGTLSNSFTTSTRTIAPVYAGTIRATKLDLVARSGGTVRR